jgi:hypothetical protein
MKKVKELTKEEVLEYRDYLTVGGLKKFIEEHNVPDDAIVLSQRVEDIYFEKHGWGVYCKEGESCWECREWNRNIEDGSYLDARPKLKAMKEELKPFTEEQIRESREQYHPVWSLAWYKDDDKDFLFLDLHY